MTSGVTENEVGKGYRIEIRHSGDGNGDEHRKGVGMEMWLRMRIDMGTEWGLEFMLGMGPKYRGDWV